MTNVPLSDLFHVRGRFRRSVHLERDFYRENAIDGYVLTATAREMLSRVISTLENMSSSKAWSTHRSLRFRQIRFCIIYCQIIRKFKRN